MERDENGVLKWVHAKHLYLDWSSIKACLIAFTIAPAIAFVFFTVVCGFADGFSLGLMSAQGKIWGLVFLIFMVLLLPSYYFWAWAHGGVDEWEYEMDARGIKGRKIVHKAWRMKVLRALAWFTMFFPAKPGQRIAMRQLLYDNEKKGKYFDLSMLRGAICDENRGKISFDTLNGVEVICMPREVYAEVAEFIEGLRQKKRPKRKPADSPKKVSKKISKTTSKEKEGAS